MINSAIVYIQFNNLGKDFIVKYVNDSSAIKLRPKSTIAHLSSTMIDYGGI